MDADRIKVMAYRLLAQQLQRVDDPPHALRLRSLIRLQDPRQVAQHRQHKPRPDLARAFNPVQTPKRALQKRQDTRSGVGPACGVSCRERGEPVLGQT